MARFRALRERTRGGCLDVGLGVQSAMDAGDGAAVAELLRTRPRPPACIPPDDYLAAWFGAVALGPESEPFLLDLGRPDLWGRLGECPTCRRIADLIARHPLLVSDTPERWAFIASFSEPPTTADVTTTEVVNHGN
jgi:hypothetical protein